jgi:hypothetical protein
MGLVEQKKYAVTYKYAKSNASGQPSALPSAISNPAASGSYQVKDDTKYIEGYTVERRSPSSTSYREGNGVWNLAWDKASARMTTSGVTFTGTWTYTADPADADAIAAAILTTLPPELKAVMQIGQGVDVAAMQQQIAMLTQQGQQQAQQIEDYRRTIDADIIAGQNQLLITRMNNEAALRSKLVELEAKAAENEKDRQIELAKLTAEQRVEAEKLFIESRNADTRAREATVKALQEAERLRMESEKNTAELAMKLSGNVKNTLTDNVIVQSPTV